MSTFLTFLGVILLVCIIGWILFKFGLNLLACVINLMSSFLGICSIIGLVVIIIVLL